MPNQLETEPASPAADDQTVAPDESTLPRPPARWRRFVRRHRRILASALVSLVVAGGVAATFFLAGPTPQAALTVALPPPSQFRELPPLITDIRPGERSHFASITMIVEIAEDDAPTLQSRESEVVDAVQTLLRDYERADLIGEEGATRLRSDALVVINRTLAPARARDVLFKEFLVD